MVWLDANLKSTKLMTGLRHHYTGEKAKIPFYNDYDVLYMVIAKRRTVWGELVVVYLPFPKISAFFENLNFIDRTISFTDLKTSKKCFGQIIVITSLLNQWYFQTVRP